VTDPKSHTGGPTVVGIVGGVASGKSTVARLLAECGARVVDADAVGHRVLELPAVRQALAEAFGDGILAPDGRVARDRLAEAVFGRPEHVEKLNAIVHPSILAEIRSEVARLKEEGGVPLIVLDAPLLMETQLDSELCQALLFVEAPAELRLRRAQDGRRMSADQFRGREQAQLPEEEKKRRAQYEVTNAGSLEGLKKRLERLWPELCRIT